MILSKKKIIHEGKKKFVWCSPEKELSYMVSRKSSMCSFIVQVVMVFISSVVLMSWSKLSILFHHETGPGSQIFAFIIIEYMIESSNEHE